MWKNNKGAALLQVLLVTVILAGLAAMLLRASLSRSSSARQTHRVVASQLLINACQVEVNALWSIKSPDTFARDMSECWMTCNAVPGSSTACSLGTNATRSHTCESKNISGITYTVTASFTSTTPDTNGQCALTYEITDNTVNTEVVL